MGKDDDDDDTGVFAHAVLRGTSVGSSADDERIFADPFPLPQRRSDGPMFAFSQERS